MNFVYLTPLRFASCKKLRVFNSASLRVRNFVYLTPLRFVYSPTGLFLHLLSYSA